MKILLERGFFSLILFALIGCSTMNAPGMRAAETTPRGWISPQGKLVEGGTNSGDIKFGQLDKDMNYYYSDSDSLPTALVKLSKKYTLDGTSWKPITDPEMLKAAIQYLKAADGAVAGTHQVRSYTVKAHDARPIGTWYSIHYVYGMRLNMSADNKVSLSAPNFRNTQHFFVKRNSDNLLSGDGPSSPPLNISYPVSTKLSQAAVVP